MIKSRYSELNNGLEKIVIGFNNINYSLYELRNSANNFKTTDPADYRSVVIKKYSKIYQCKDPNIPSYILEEVFGLSKNFKEEWVPVPDWFYSFYNVAVLNYEVSNLGRIRIDNTILIQEAYKDGYLVISKNNDVPQVKNHSVEIYKFISAAFLGNPNGRDIHHINNNGYDCRPDNLILLEPRDHSKAHGFFVISDTNRNLNE